MKILFLVGFLILSACAAIPPKLDPSKIRAWSDELETEFPNEDAAIIHYKKGNYELHYVAAKHSNTFGDDTLNLVSKLFEQYKFKVVLIESIPYSSGQSPGWFINEALKGRSKEFIAQGESGLAALLANERNIPFFAGEPDHVDIYRTLKNKGYKDIDVLGFYLVRQIPQWVRQQENSKKLLEQKAPRFLTNYCKTFSIYKCPDLAEIKKWFKSNMGKELKADVRNEFVAPILNSKILTQKISGHIGLIRDQFTLSIIEDLLVRYQKVAVIYGSSHFITLRHSFDVAFDPPTHTLDRPTEK